MKNEYLKVALIFGLVLFIFFAKPILNNLVMLPAETLYYADSVYHAQVDQVKGLPSNGLLSDLIFQMYPWRHYIGQSFENGIFPLWNPYSLTGLPFLANDQSSIFEFTKLTSYLFGISTNGFMLFSGFLLLWLAGFFTYCFARNLKISQTGSFVSGLAFMMSGPLIVWLGYPLTSAIVWLPLVLLAIDKLAASPSKIWIVIMALAIAFQFFGGNPEISLFIFVLAFLYALFRFAKYRPVKTKTKLIFKRQAVRKAKALVLAVLLGMVLASVQLLPTLELLGQSTAMTEGRGGLAGYSVYDAVKNGQWNNWHSAKDIKNSLENLILLAYPDFFGSPVFREYWKIDNYNESAIYVGIIPLSLVLISLASIFRKHRRRKDVIFWAVIAFICLGAFLYFPFLRLVAYLPFFKIVAIGRLRFIFVFALAILAGYGLDWLFKKREQGLLASAKNKLAVFGLVYLFITSSVVAAVWFYNKFASKVVSQQMWQSKRLFLLFVFLFLILSLYLMLFANKNRLKYRLGKILFISLVAVELISFGYNYHPAIEEKFIYPRTEAITYLQENIGNHRFTSYKDQLVNTSSTLLPNESLIWGLQDIRGYEIVKLKRYDAFELHFAKTNDGFGGAENRFIYKFFDSKIFNTLGIKYLIQDKDDIEVRGLNTIESLEIVFEDEAVYIYENKSVMPRAFMAYNIHPVIDHKKALEVFARDEFRPDMTALVEDGNFEQLWDIYENNPDIPIQPAQITSYQSNRVEISVDAQRDGFLVLTDAYEKNWQVFLDGQRVVLYPADVAFRGLFVPEGQHEIVFEYHPQSFYLGIYLSSAALLICLVLMILWLVDKKN